MAASSSQDQAQIIAAFSSLGTQAQILAPSSSKLTQIQITSLINTAAAHDAAVEAAKFAMKAGEEAKKAWEKLNKAAEDKSKEYEIAQVLAVDAMEAENKAARDALASIEKANQSESDNAKTVLNADLTAEDARTVRLFGSGIIPDRTFPDKNYGRQHFSFAYSMLARFIKSTKCDDLLTNSSQKIEEVLELGNSLELYGLTGNWLTDICKDLRDKSTHLDRLKRMEVMLDKIINTTKTSIRHLETDLSGCNTLLDDIRSHLSDVETRTPTYFNIDLYHSY